MKSILVPIDFSENSRNAAEYAVVIAQAFKATVTLINVYTPAVTRYNMISALMAEEVTRARQEGKEKLDVMVATSKEVYPDVSCTGVVVVGEIIGEIVGYASEHGADLIVMGTMGASGLEKILFGSTASAVIEKADCPVLSVPAAALFEAPKKIMFATDYAYSDIAGARMLTEFAKFFEAAIIFVHITQSDEDEVEEQVLISKFSKEIKLATNYPHISYKVLSDSTVSMGLDLLIDESGIDMIALSTRKRTIFEKLYNPSLTKKMAQYVSIPLLAFKADAKEGDHKSEF